MTPKPKIRKPLGFGNYCMGCMEFLAHDLILCMTFSSQEQENPQLRRRSLAAVRQSGLRVALSGVPYWMSAADTQGSAACAGAAEGEGAGESLDGEPSLVHRFWTLTCWVEVQEQWQLLIRASE